MNAGTVRSAALGRRTVVPENVTPTAEARSTPVVDSAVTGRHWGGFVLGASDLAAFVTGHLDAHFDVHAEEDAPEGERAWWTYAQLMTDHAARIEVLRARILAEEDGLAPQVAVKYLVGWIGGAVGDAVGFVHAMTGAGIVADPAQLRWREHPDGWMDRVDLAGCAVLVPPGHPWAGREGTTVVADEAEVARRTTEALVEALTPMVAVIKGDVKMAPPALWSEVADGLGMCLGYQPDLPVSAVAVRRARALLDVPGAPWRKTPLLRIGPTALGDGYLVQRGGCCFAYKVPSRDEDPEEPEEFDEEHAAYRARFAMDPPGKRYCGTCSLRPAQDALERQLFWYERRRLERGRATGA